MVQEHILKNFLEASRQGFGLGRYKSSTSIGNALEITSNGRARAFDKSAEQNNSNVGESSKICLEKIILMGGVFSGASAITYLATGQSDLSTYMAPIVGSLVTAYTISEPTCKSAEQQQTSSNYEKEMQVLDTAKPEEIKRILKRYKHYYY